MNNKSAADGIISFDFERTFPHKFWVSNWLADDTYPDGVCYKILSVRNEQSKTAEIVLLRSFRDGSKEILHRADLPLAELENAASVFVDGLTKKLNLDFEEQNFQMTKTLDEFNKIASAYGWHMHQPDRKS